MAFADNIYFLRKREGISQEELAYRLNVSRQAVSKWETGESYPETEKIITLCDMFGVTMDQLLRGDVTEEKTVPVTESEPPQEQRQNETSAEETNDVKERPYKTAQAVVQSILWLIAVVIYIISGIFWDLWHPMWIIFVFMPAVNSGVEIIFTPARKRLKKVLSFLENLAIFGSVCTYLLCGFFIGMWGTMWVVFLSIPIVCTVCEIFKKH